MVLDYDKMNAIPVNDSVIVLTQNDGQGWHLRKGDIIEFDYSNLILDSITDLTVGLMRNDIFKFGQRQSLKTTNCHLIIPEDGLYHLCILRKY